MNGQFIQSCPEMSTRYIMELSVGLANKFDIIVCMHRMFRNVSFHHPVLYNRPWMADEPLYGDERLVAYVRVLVRHELHDPRLCSEIGQHPVVRDEGGSDSGL